MSAKEPLPASSEATAGEKLVRLSALGMAKPRYPSRAADTGELAHRLRWHLPQVIETTTNDVSAFKHYRTVEHRQRPTTHPRPVRETIYSLTDLREILRGCNGRYLGYFSSLDDFSAGVRGLDHLTQPPSHQRPHP
jgi:hypothetical protein